MDNLLKVEFIREVKYPERLANVVVVPKKGGKWRVCVDYTDLNDACPKECFCKTLENSNFLKNGKMVISVKIRNFSRYRRMKRTSPLESSRKI